MPGSGSYPGARDYRPFTESKLYNEMFDEIKDLKKLLNDRDSYIFMVQQRWKREERKREQLEKELKNMKEELKHETTEKDHAVKLVEDVTRQNNDLMDLIESQDQELSELKKGWRKWIPGFMRF